MASLNINAADLPVNDSFELLPEGWYNAKIKTVELKTTNDGTGKYIAVCYKLPNNRTVYGNLNIKNKSDVAEKIGLGQLNQLMGSIGIAKLTDTDQLVGHDLQIKVGLGKKQEGYEQRNEVKGFKAIEGGPLPVADLPKTAPWG